MRDFKDIILRFAEGKESQEERELIKNTLLKQVRVSGREEAFRGRWGDDFEEDLLSDLREKVVKLRENLESKEFINWSYFLKLVISCVEEFFQKLRNMQEFPYDKLKASSEEYDLEFEETIFFSYEANPEEDLESVEFYYDLLELLDEKDYPILCYYLCKEFYKNCKKPEDISENNLYKKWERLKKRLRERLTYEPSESAVAYFTERFLSEICKKFGYIN
ncbi:hypothetical protein [Thermocrinis sp.]